MTSIESLRRGLRAVEVMSERQPLGVTELARNLGVPKSTAQRLLTTLAQAGWIERTDDEITR